MQSEAKIKNKNVAVGLLFVLFSNGLTKTGDPKSE